MSLVIKSRVLTALIPLALTTSQAWAAEPIYDQTYPQYAQYCGLSQITKISTAGIKEVGGKGGHGVLYLRGACRDRSADYPRIKVCDANDPLPHEVGTSVNSDFMTANWVAVDSKDFFFSGGIKPGQAFDVPAYELVQKEAQELDIMNGVQIHPELFANKTPGMTDIAYQYQDSIGTDYGINMGRNMTCGRVPLGDQQLQQVVDYYNSRNRYYHDGHIPYNWSFLTDNCTHIVHNALAAAGFWSAMALDQPLPQALGSIDIPMNEFVNLMLRTNDLPLEEPDELFNDAYARAALMERGWLPTQPGALAEYIPVHQLNDIFATNLTEILFSIPVIDPNQADRARFISDARYTDVKANLEYFLSRYTAIKNGRQSVTVYTQQHGKMAAREIDPGFPAFFTQYYQYIDQQIATVTEKLSKL